MNKVLITGSTGFVGRNLVSYLKDEVELICPDRTELLGPLPEYEHIIHLAGKAHDIKSASNSTEYYETNYELTQRIFDDFLQSDASKLIFISSVKAAADHLTGPLTEEYLANPQTHYGKSKLLAEQHILNHPLPKGKSFYILRPCMIHGPGNKGNLNLLYKFVSKRIPYPLADFENRRSFLSVENLCFVIKELIEREDIPSGIYHVADDEALSTNQLVELIGEASDRPAKLWRINKNWIHAIAQLGDLLKFPLNTERLSKLTENYIVDNSKLIKALGKNLPVNAKDGIVKTIRSFD